jgi:predicted metal-dependent phosphoesterase TrpH
MFKVDLHTHSIKSPDGSLRRADYQSILDRGMLDVIAVTDHNSIEFAQQLHSELGNRIIIGEEITAREGEIIGLFLSSLIPAGLSAAETADHIHEQGGLVYVPHPFETVRTGLSLTDLENIAESVDIIEIHNGRAVFQDKATLAVDWAKRYQLPGAASSDAHGKHGWGKTYSLIAESPTKDNLSELLYSATYQVGSPGIRGMLYPKVNRMRRRLGFKHV